MALLAMRVELQGEVGEAEDQQRRLSAQRKAEVRLSREEAIQTDQISHQQGAHVNTTTHTQPPLPRMHAHTAHTQITFFPTLTKHYWCNRNVGGGFVWAIASGQIKYCLASGYD